jgi:sugar phosphate isomerase/epimerase
MQAHDRSLSLAALTVLELSPPEMVVCAAEAGYSHVGLRLLPATTEEPVYPVIGDTPMVREIARRLATTGVQVLDVEILRLKPGTDVNDYRAVLETGARLGARHVLIAGNDPDESRLTERFAALAALAAPLHLSLALEPMPWTDVRDVNAAWRVVERSRAKNAGVLVDAIHFDRAASTPLDLATIPRSRRSACPTCSCATRRRRVPSTPRRCCTRRAPSG